MNWLFDQSNLSETPSLLDLLSLETEKRYRSEGVEFIRHLCDRLGLRHITMSTACVLFHRFYMLKSFKEFSRWNVATACLFLAGKAEETPKKCKNVIKTAKVLLTEMGRVEESSKLNQLRFLGLESVILQTLKFDLCVRQPYSHLLLLAQRIKGDKDIINEIVQMAWSFLNDSLYVPLCVVYPPELIALACLYLAFTTKIKQLNVEADEIQDGIELEGKIMEKSHTQEWWNGCINDSIPYMVANVNDDTSDKIQEISNYMESEDLFTQKYDPSFKLGDSFILDGTQSSPINALIQMRFRNMQSNQNAL